MAALRATSDELRLFPMLTSHMLPYGGPLCFPHSRVQSRRNANLQREIDDDTPSDAAAHVFTGVWRGCDDPSCRRWRHIDSKCCFADDGRADLGQDACRTGWPKWLREAPERHAAAVHRNCGLRQIDEGEDSRSHHDSENGEDQWDEQIFPSNSGLQILIRQIRFQLASQIMSMMGWMFQLQILSLIHGGVFYMTLALGEVG